MKARYRPGKAPVEQSIQIIFEVKAPEPVLRRLTPQFFRECLLRIAAEEYVPGVRVSLVVWRKDGEEYEYDDETEIPTVLNKALQVFGLANIKFSAKTA